MRSRLQHRETDVLTPLLLLGRKTSGRGNDLFYRQRVGATCDCNIQGGRKYDLYTLDMRGALLGTYSVVVSKTEAPADSVNKDAGFDASGKDLSMEQSAANVGKPTPKAKQLLPAKYGSASTTTLSFEVKNAGNVFDIKLE